MDICSEKISTFMSTRLVTVEMDDPLYTLKEIFDNTRFHHLLVVDTGKLVGVISDRDLLKSVSHKIYSPSATRTDLETLDKKSHQIMTREVICLPPDATIREAIAIFNLHQISCIPVVHQDGSPLGIVSWRDILRTLCDGRGAEKCC